MLPGVRPFESGEVIEHPSPNHGARPASARIDLVLLHYTGMRSAADALERMCDPAAEVSAHYMIDEAGTVYRLVAETRRAWHAGVARWRGEADINDRSLGIELVNPGHELGYRPFPEAQLAALEDLLADILQRYRIDPRGVVGHSDVAPTRKQDPGELFPWRRLAARQLAYWPKARPASCAPDIDRARGALTGLGYDLDQSGDDFAPVLTAFQRRFRPSLCDGRLDRGTMAMLIAIEPDLVRTPLD